jgi:membrane fusion protein, multidrug efflux system
MDIEVTHIPLIKKRTSSFIALIVGSGLLLGFFAFRPDSGAKSPQPGNPGGAASTAPGSSAPQQALPVQVYRVSPETVTLTVPATGRLLAKEAVDLVSELSRRLVRVRVEEGSVVARGDVLFELDSAELVAQLAQLNVQLSLAKINAERGTTLAAEGLLAAQEAQKSQAEYDAMLAERRVLQVTLDKTKIRAPFAGTVGLRRVSEGAWVTPSTVLVSLHDTSQLKLDFSISEKYAGMINPGSEVTFRAQGRPEVFVARVTAFEPAVDQNSRSIVLRSVVNNDKSLLPGTFASVEVPLRAASVLTIPSLAVIPTAQGHNVFVAKDGVARAVKVELGTRDAERVQVMNGLSANDDVIVTNLLRVREGAPVAVSPVAAAEAKP